MELTVGDDGLDRVFRALAHEHRREILHSLALRPRSISELAELRRLSLPAIHKHIGALEDAALIRRRKVGRTNVVALQRAPLSRLQDWVGQFRPDWGTDDESLENYVDRVRHPGTEPKEHP
jgi:DNA-binding transcriptional ArsR family regulator